VEVGEFVLAIGNPGTEFGSSLPFTVTSGIVSAKGRELGIIRRAAQGSNYAIEDLIQTDAVINPGNSGGPLVNHRGEVIGINTAIASLTGFYQGYGFAIPINLARSVMDDLIKYGRVRRGALGVSVTTVTREDAQRYGLRSPKGVLIQDFTNDSPARAAGLEREDVIVEVDGREIERVGQLQRIIASYNPGTTVEVTVVRDGDRRQFEVELEEAPVPQPEVAEREAEPRHESLLGIEVQSLSMELARQAGFPENANLEGVIVTGVARFSPAWNAALRSGWVIRRINGEKVTNAREFEEALSNVEPGEIISLDAVAAQDGETFQRVFNIALPAE
jgi:serine protease Do